MNSRKIRKLAVWSLLLPHLAGVMVFYLLPFGWGIVQSLRTASGFGLANYAHLFRNEAFRLAAVNTLTLALVTVPLLVGLSMAAALYAHRHLKSGFLLLHPVLINFAIPTASIAYMWTILFEDFGWVNVWVHRGFGVPHQNWLDGALLYVPIVSIFLFKYLAFPIFIFFGGRQSLPAELYEAASIDGASAFKKFWHLTVPLLTPEILFTAVLGFFYNFKIYKEAYVLFGAYPPKEAYLIQHFLNNQFQKVALDTLTAAAAVMAVAIGAVIYGLIRANRSAYFPS